MKLKKNDNVMIIAGKDKGKTGVIERVFPTEDRMVVKGIALAKKHVKPSKKNPSGGIIDINLKIQASNAMIVCPSCGKASRITYNVTDKGKIRLCTRCKQSVEGGTK